MSKNLLLSVMIAALFGIAGTLAQDAESQDESQETPTPAGAAGEAGEPVSDDVFIPSEEVQAAEELAFPVDI